MTFQKRVFDLVLAVILTVLLSPVFVILSLVLLIIEGRPVFYISERMKTPDQSFRLVKFRTMRASDHNTGVTGGDKGDRVSPLQSAFRRFRVDEIPQLWNVLKGDMSFVGPRPPLRIYTDAFPKLYSEVLECRPGLTGLASLEFHAREDVLLSACKTSAETDEVYRRRCVPRKARLDLIYGQHQSVCYDISLIWQTFRRLFSVSKGN